MGPRRLRPRGPARLDPAPEAALLGRADAGQGGVLAALGDPGQQPQRLARRRGALEAVLGPVLDEPEDEVVPRDGDVRARPRDGPERPRGAARQGFEQDLPERVEVGAPVHGAALGLLGRHVDRRPGEGRPAVGRRAGEARGERRPAGGGGRERGPDPEVGELGLAAGIEEDVRRLQVAVDDAARVRELERLEDGLRDRVRVRELEPARQRRQPVRQRPAGEVLDRDEGGGAIDGAAHDPHDPRVVEVEEELGLAHQAVGDLGARDLEGDGAPGLRLPRLVDGRLAAVRDEADDLVRAEARARRERRRRRRRPGTRSRRHEPRDLARPLAQGHREVRVAGLPEQALDRSVARAHVAHVAHARPPPSSRSASACAAFSRAATVFRSRPTVSATSSIVSPPW